MPTVKGVVWRTVKESFPMWERLGIHVTPVHFYEPIPDTRSLPDSIWDSRSQMVGIDLNDEAQVLFLREVANAYRAEYETFPTQPTDDSTRYHLDNDAFRSVDAEILYSMVRRLRPRRIIEVGSGFTTLLMAQAVRANAGQGDHACEYTVCDPYPGPTVRNGLPEVSRLIVQPVQDVAVTEFERLDDGDILFIDSSHVLKIGSDVRYLFLEVIPRLSPGVMVHVHDIFLPAEYPRRWIVTDRHFWNEQYLLQAFLAFNTAWEIVWAGSHMHLDHARELAEAFPSYTADAHPGSFWMRRRPGVRSEVPPA